VTTPRIFSRNGVFYTLYGGSQSENRKDMPDAFGLARSTDLIHWEKYPQNPVFHLGSEGQWDDGAIWFGTVFEWENHLYLLYEGGRLSDIVNHSPALTQVGLAAISCDDFDQQVNEW
jgi:sucrose-6-phosphate hydrolase SacC (GH32 family)